MVATPRSLVVMAAASDNCGDDNERDENQETVEAIRSGLFVLAEPVEAGCTLAALVVPLAVRVLGEERSDQAQQS